MGTMIVIALLGGSVLVIFGGLIGHSLSQHLLAGDLRRRAELGRTIGEQWRQMQAERDVSVVCPHCGWAAHAERAEASR